MDRRSGAFRESSLRGNWNFPRYPVPRHAQKRLLSTLHGADAAEAVSSETSDTAFSLSSTASMLALSNTIMAAAGYRVCTRLFISLRGNASPTAL